ncbi:hypothetical protein AVEN_195901-1 [Araneus ventricosus]|uniref:Uncharacterized protein n=1 Tax=Araneus ventricosus TaxID=182803 RepID=A0A4Y2DXI7_ARAVE|nr:hypothetical protein AVEN_195901-1 [Araneus ventricosus]
MKCRFPATLVLWLGREFYRDMYRNADGMEPSTPDLGDKLGGDLGDKFGDIGDEMWDLKSTRIVWISLLCAEIQMIPCDVTACWKDYK